ncbi:hypothetical protein L6164_024925 [Bauhinia variegata]|uniref:Uncharacterized protein n=1 Tax=Bauhinia variegata TaxID=167791 RepID=A0ACB9M1I1_BAUVA|nr:hypothetical protein L6164_024925 [Bauhinia variegata]
MVSLKRLIAMARKWQRMAGIERGEISLPKVSHKLKVAEKGHFVAYSMDKRRFVIPLGYLSSNIFRELFRMSEQVFGLPTDGPITLPCDAAFMEYVVSLLRKIASLDLENALLVASFGSSHCLQPLPASHHLSLTSLVVP